MNEDLTFEYGVGTEVQYGCAATLKNEFWYFGGSSSSLKRQVYYKKYSFDMYWFFFRQAKLWDASLNVSRT